MSLILTIFILALITEAISWIGQSLLLEFAYALYQRIFNASAVSRQRQLKTDVLSAKAQLLQTSAQDEFAKWAKLKRSVEKGWTELEKLNGEMTSNKASFSLKFNSFVFILTTGLQFFIGWWYRRSAVFYLPPGWFGPLTWWLALPFAPKGSVSVGVWQMACRRVIKIGERIVRDIANPSVEAASTQTDETLFEKKNT